MVSDTQFRILEPSRTRAANGAPIREPEVWDQGTRDFNPLLGHVLERPPIAVSPDFARTTASGLFDVTEYLAKERAKDLLRFSTAGSVDDGKSTLIGRLLYDTQSVYDDQVRSIEGKGTTGAGVLDLALLTDGLRAEREQGITIDVAYRYFSTAGRKFIVADTPGHEQYTRNMATGASTASLAIVLVDARKGVLIQSRRHACITALLGVPHIVIAINKMDLVGYDEEVFNAVSRDFTAFFEQMGELRPPHLSFVPVSALSGDNVVHTTLMMPWYQGPSLLQVLETVPTLESKESDPFRMAVQRVVRPAHDFRGFAGQIASGSVKPGDSVLVLPSGRTSRVRSIGTFRGDLLQARAPQSVSLTLEDELDISRGDLLVAVDSPAIVTSRLSASLVWMDEQPAELTRRYVLKHTSRTVQAQIVAVEYRLDVAALERRPADTLTLNEIGLVTIESIQPLVVDLYATNRITGSFVLIDPISNATVAAGMIRGASQMSHSASAARAVSAVERADRWRYAGIHLHLEGPSALADEVERNLFERGVFVVRLDDSTASFVQAFTSAGAMVFTHRSSHTSTAAISGRLTLVTTLEEILKLLQDHSESKEMTR